MPQLPAALPGQLLQWYDENRRILPWREKPSPYRTWISEVMLQQTRVEAGIAYFERFTAALPDIPALAAVEEQQLLKLWEGLGYYSRARNLKKAAIQLMQEHNGQLPADFAALCRLPGLGEYSAGAIASIAFDIRVPAVDGNVLRVAARLMNDARNIEDTAVKKEFRQIVWEVLPQHRVGDFNQSLMELGALICLPNGRPLCESCPVRDLCQSCAAGTQLTLPTRQKKPRRRKEEKTVLLLCRLGEVQITQRPADGLLASLWEFPTLPGLHTSAEVAELLSVPTEAVTPLGPATHIFTHIEWQMQGYRVELPPKAPLWGGCVSIPVAELFASYPIPSAYAAYLKTSYQFIARKTPDLKDNKFWNNMGVTIDELVEYMNRTSLYRYSFKDSEINEYKVSDILDIVNKYINKKYTDKIISLIMKIFRHLITVL